MGMTPDQFLESFVEANYNDCAENPGCVRRAFNAAVAASHLLDHYYTYYQRHDPQRVARFTSIGAFVERVSADTGGCFRDIRSIANAYKHLYTSTAWSVSSAGAVEAIDLTGSDDLRSMEVDSDFVADGFSQRVVYTRKDGTRLEFLATLGAVIDYFDRQLLRAHAS